MARHRPPKRPTAPSISNAEAFAVVQPGFEDQLTEELIDLGIDATSTPGGSVFTATPEALAMALVWSRIPSGIRVRMGTVPAGSLAAIAQGVRNLPWAAVTTAGRPVKVDASLQGSRLKRRDFVAEKVQHAVADSLRQGSRRSAARGEPCVIRVRVQGQKATISVDAAGELLHRRGWRKATGKAPLRENLAAGLLARLDWGPDEALVDPMCGSGTFSIEAACMARGLPAGAKRSFAIESWPSFDQRVLAAARAARVEGAMAPKIHTSDRNDGAVIAARANAERAGVSGDVNPQKLPFEELEPPAETGLLIVNAPYGKRVKGPNEVDHLMTRWGAILRDKWGGWRWAFLVANTRHMRALDPTMEVAAKLSNGGIPVVLGLREP